MSTEGGIVTCYEYDPARCIFLCQFHTRGWGPKRSWEDQAVSSKANTQKLIFVTTVHALHTCFPPLLRQILPWTTVWLFVITFVLTWEREVCLLHLLRNAFPSALHTWPGAFASLSISEQLPVSPPALTCRAVPPLPLCLPRAVHLDTLSVSFSVGSVLRALFKMGISPTPFPLNPDWLLTGDILNLLIEFIVKFPSPSARR